MSLHPGLLLDKQHEPWPVDKKEQAQFVRTVLESVAKQPEPPRLLDSKRRLWLAAQGEGAVRWKAQTKSPLALHLSRATAFENAGLCLHPLFGFAYIPGSGLKGMARAFALNVKGLKEKDRDFELVFGREAQKEEDSAAGYVVFHDAWPVKWPKLEVDIVNCHHGDYYRNGEPPEDWEAPNPVNFLTVKSGATFEFALSLRRPHPEGERLLKLAREWLAGALAILGAGAKTAAGYGRFAEPGVERPTFEGKRADFECTLGLVSPAFLAGAGQRKEDCELRGATLRGLLRWWWRALHAGILPVKQMRELEGRIWGTTEVNSAIQLEVEPLDAIQLMLWDRSPKDQEILGRQYLAYGMEGYYNPEKPKSTRPRRHYVVPRAKWRVRLAACGTNTLTAKQVLDHGIAALWALTAFGGVGAKCRRGFGSLSLINPSASVPRSLDEAMKMVGRWPVAKLNRPDSPSLHWRTTREIKLGGKDALEALDNLGAAYKAFTLAEKHKPAKESLGLPRVLDRGRTPLGRYDRFASPLHFKLVWTQQGFFVRISALHSPHLPDLETSKQYLEKCIQHMEAFLKKNGK